jgi:hypothetical protein
MMLMRSMPVHFTQTLSLPVLLVFLACVDSPPVSATEGKHQVIHQLRIYELFDDTREAFHERFRDHAQRIMERYDFNIVAMWETRTDDAIEFVYLLEWPDEQTMTAQWEAFMADQEWSDIKAATGKMHGRFVGAIEDRTLRLTDYSPGSALLSPRE